MDNNQSGKKLDKFLAGKGFYIVLFLCAAIIGVSAWSLVSSPGADAPADADTALEQSGAVSGDYDYEPVQPAVASETPVQTEPEDPPETAQTSIYTQGEAWNGSEGDYKAPLDGEIQRAYSMKALGYDKTMADWRTHDGIDIAAKDGTAVKAAHSGKVESAEQDDMYGVTVVIDQGGGVKTTYANLRSQPAVKAGDQVAAGDVIGYIGQTAICESAQEPHVHIAMSVNGESVDPGEYIPG
jgi:murein DD-endopeptidase MepM/ murein hydrolase activator NlpD